MMSPLKGKRKDERSIRLIRSRAYRAIYLTHRKIAANLRPSLHTNTPLLTLGKEQIMTRKIAKKCLSLTVATVLVLSLSFTFKPKLSNAGLATVGVIVTTGGLSLPLVAGILGFGGISYGLINIYDSEQSKETNALRGWKKVKGWIQIVGGIVLLEDEILDTRFPELDNNLIEKLNLSDHMDMVEAYNSELENINYVGEMVFENLIRVIESDEAEKMSFDDGLKLSYELWNEYRVLNIDDYDTTNDDSCVNLISDDAFNVVKLVAPFILEERILSKIKDKK